MSRCQCRASDCPHQHRSPNEDFGCYSTAYATVIEFPHPEMEMPPTCPQELIKLCLTCARQWIADGYEGVAI